jgi:hypothetical protein
MCPLCVHAQVNEDLNAGNARESRGARWAPLCLPLVLLLGPVLLALWTQHTVIQRDLPSDQDLAAEFFAHQERFDELADMLNADHGVLSQTRVTAIDLPALERTLGHSRTKQYVAILKKISVVDLRYFPASGKILLLPTGASADIEGAAKTYLHLPTGQAEPLFRHDGYHLRGPGIYLVTGDRPLRQSWFIHHNTTVNITYAPY